MASEPPIIARARVLRPLSDVTYRIALPNGKKLVGHLSRKLKDAQAKFAIDDAVRVEMTPYDFSKARIAGLWEGT